MMEVEPKTWRTKTPLPRNSRKKWKMKSIKWDEKLIFVVSQFLPNFDKYSLRFGNEN